MTLVAIGCLVIDALKAAKTIEKKGISVEVIDPRTLSPLDSKTILNSVLKTGRLIVADPGWQSFGAASEIISIISEKYQKKMKSNPIKLSLPDSHTPMSKPLEKNYYLNQDNFILAIERSFKKK